MRDIAGKILILFYEKGSVTHRESAFPIEQANWGARVVVHGRKSVMLDPFAGGLLKFFLILLIVGAAIGQPSIVFDVFDASGNEGDDITAPGVYMLSSCVGQPTPVNAGPLTSPLYQLHPGFRKVDLDLRYPYNWFSLVVGYSEDTSFTIIWSGIDTTIEDGVGWGVWNYDLQYRTDPVGIWTDWLIGTTDTFATFGPEAPLDVLPGTTYYFRLRATDLARNESPWGLQDSTIVDYSIEFCIYTIAPGVATGPANYATLEYYSQPGIPVTVDIWEGECAYVWCAPNAPAAISGLTSASDATARWIVDPGEDTSWTIDGSETAFDLPYWHQLQPIIELYGTDVTHTVQTLHHDQFGPGHLETGLYGNWTQWTDYGSLLEFVDSTTGTPVRFAEAGDSVRFHDISAFFADTIRYTNVGYIVNVMTNFGDSISADDVWYSSPYSTNWFDASTHQIGVHDTVFLHEGEAWIFDDWNDGSTDTSQSVVILSDTTFTANFSHKYRVWVENSDGFGMPDPPVGDYWFDIGDTAEGNIDTSGVSGYWIIGYFGTGSALSGGGDEFWFEVYDSSRIRWRWGLDTGELCTLMVYSRYGHPHPIGEYIVPRGTYVYCSVEDSTYEEGDWHFCTGWLGDGAVVPASGVDNILGFTILGSGWLVWQWDGSTDLPLIISSSPGTYGPPVPDVGLHWIPMDDLVEAFVDNNPDGLWWCIGNISWGSMMSSSADSVYFNISEPTGIDWQWMWWDGPLDTLWIFSRFGHPFPTRGRHFYPADTVDITAWVTTPDGEHYCSGWTGEGSVPSSGDTNWTDFRLDMFSTLTWDWDDSILYPFNVSSEMGLGYPIPEIGVHWYIPYSHVTAFVRNPDGSYFCIGYYGFGSLPPFDYVDSVDFDITRASGIDWLWDDDAFSLVVTGPDYIDPIPPVGITWHPFGRVIPAWTQDTVYDGAFIRYSNTGWGGSGSVPISGDSNAVEFSITSNSSIDWRYFSEYYLTVLHDGLPGGVDPDTLGVEGWYELGDSAVLITDSVVWFGDYPYIFTVWTSPGTPTIGDEFAESTYIAMFDAYTVTANFGVAYWVQIMKDPPEDTLGWIIVDADTFDEVSLYESYWLAGRVYDFDVSVLDTSYDERYEFISWRDDTTALPHRIANVISDTIFYADYNKFYHMIAGKHPPDDTLGYLIVDTDTFYADSSLRQDFWWLDGSSHYLEASTPDSSEFVKYVFEDWSVSTPTPGMFYDPVTGPDSIIANYDRHFKCRVQKDPLEDYGYISLSGERFDGVSHLDFWTEESTSVLMTVGKYDVTADSVYIFQYWAVPGVPSDTNYHTYPIVSPDTFRAVYNIFPIHIEIEVGQYGTVPSESLYWNIEDSLFLEESRVMDTEDSLKIYNWSNVPAQLGLNIRGVFDTTDHWVLDTFWTPGYYTGNNKFVLQGRFDDTPEPPTVWDPARDYIKTDVTWATEFYFGPGGYNIPPVGYPSSTDKLWLRFIAPSSSGNPHHTRMILVKLYARMYMP